MNETPDVTDDGGHLNDEGVALFVDALKLGTADQLPEFIRTHVAECDACQHNVTGLFALLRKEDYSGVERHPYFRLRKRKLRTAGPWLWRAAAAIAALVLIPALVYYLSVRPGSEDLRRTGLTTAPGDSSAPVPRAGEGPQTPPQTELAANFTPHPEYEALVTAGTRSTALKGATPVNGAVLGGSGIRFDWRREGSERLTLVIINAVGRDIYSARIVTLPHTTGRDLEPGLYYWKVVDEQEAVHFGKFTVRDGPHFPRSTNPAQK